MIDQEGTNKVDFRYLELDQVESHSSTVKLLGVKLALMNRSSCRCSSSNNNLNPQDKIDSFSKLYYRKAERLDISNRKENFYPRMACFQDIESLNLRQL